MKRIPLGIKKKKTHELTVNEVPNIEQFSNIEIDNNITE